MKGVVISIIFLALGFLLAQYVPLSAGERFAVSDNFVDSVQRIPDDAVVVFPDKAVIEVPGLTYAKVKSNSMAPFITDKSTVFEKPLSEPEFEVRKGDIISFQPPADWGVKGPVLHYVDDILLIEGEFYYVTKGINQGFDPSPVPAKNVIGVVVGIVR